MLLIKKNKLDQCKGNSECLISEKAYKFVLFLDLFSLKALNAILYLFALLVANLSLIQF